MESGDLVTVSGKRDQMIRAREAYDFGLSVPIYKDTFVGELVQIMEDLDGRKLSDDLVKRIKRRFARDQDLSFDVEIIERGHVWLLKKDDLEYMLRKAGDKLLFYDCSDFEQIKRPTLKDVALWFGFTYPHVRAVAAREKWREERTKRDEEMRSEAMESVRADAIEDIVGNMKKRLQRFETMEDVYDENLEAGNVKVTTRDLIAVSMAAHRIEKDMTGMGNPGGEHHPFIEMLIKTGIAEISKPAEIIDVEAEDVTVEEE